MEGDELSLFIGPDGQVQFIYDDRLAQLFGGEAAETRRASHVEPAAGGGWTADMGPVGGPVLKDAGMPFATRAAALAAEHEWLEAQLRAGKVV